MVGLSDLPPEVLVIVFEGLDASTLRAVSECCTKLSQVINESERLTRKFTLHMRYPMDLRNIAGAIENSTRRYRKLKITKSREQYMHNAADPVVRGMFLRFGETIHELIIDWSNASRARDANFFDLVNRRARAVGMQQLGNRLDAVGWHAQAIVNLREDVLVEFVNLIRNFSSIRKLTLFTVHLERGRHPNDPALQFPNFKEFVTKQCDPFCFDVFSSCNRLEKLHVRDPWWSTRNPGIDTFEMFLISQTELRDLCLKNFQYPRLFQLNRTNQIVFRLESLELENVFFADRTIAFNFFHAQNQLRKVKFQLHNEKVRQLDEMQWYNNIIRSIVHSSNVNLRELHIEKLRYKIDDYSFIANIVNPAVRKLIFKVTAEDKSSDLFKIFIKMFPNLEAVEFKVENKGEDSEGICFDEGTVLERSNSLIIRNSSVRSLVNVHAGALINFEYVPGRTGEFIDDYFGGFFHRQ